MGKIFLFLAWTISIYSSLGLKPDERPARYDLVIYGGTSAGIAAAIQGSRMGKKVVLIEPSQRIGGLTTGGLGATDIGDRNAIGGISREFYKNIQKYYKDPVNWKWQERVKYFDIQSRTAEDDEVMGTFEPSAALKVYKKMIASENIDLVYGERLNRENGVKKVGATITSIEMESGAVYEGEMFIDATYVGDLMAAAGVSYTIGRESNSQYGETLNGVQPNNYNITLRYEIARNARNHNFIARVDPYIVKGDKSSGVLPFINPEGPGVEGSGDDKIQAYNLRLTLTDHPENRIPFEKPDNYNEMYYELLFRNYEARRGSLEDMYDYGTIVPLKNDDMPNRKTDTNNQKALSTDFIGQNYDYPEASYEERKNYYERHLNYTKGLMWTLANHSRIPEKVRNKVSKWGTAKDEFPNSGGWTPQLYIREARRMVSDYVMTQHNAERLRIVEDPVGLAAYGMDSHHVQRYIDANGYVQNEGNVSAGIPVPFPISYRSIVPKEDEASNLLVPVCVSASHIAYGSIRMEPVFMVLGQSAATAASLAIEQEKSVQDLNYEKLKAALVEDEQRLEYVKNSLTK